MLVEERRGTAWKNHSHGSEMGRRDGLDEDLDVPASHDT